MKKQIFTLLSLALFAVALVGCNSDSRSEISAGTIKSLVEEQMAQEGADADYGTVKTGYYELNDNKSRYELRKLAAAGVITYNCERIEGYSNVRNGYDWWTGRYSYKKVKKYFYFVNVELTSDGRKCVVDQLPELDVEVDEDMIQPEIGYYPEFDVPETEVFPEDVKPEANVEAEAEPEAAVDAEPETVVEAEPEVKVEKDKTPLEIAREKEKSEIYDVLLYRVRVVKARNILLSPIEGAADAEIITEIYDVTPFGRVMNKVIDGVRDCDDVSLRYYEDKGWVLR